MPPPPVTAVDRDTEGCEYYEHKGLNVEGEGDYRAKEYYKGDGGLGCVYMPDADDASVGKGPPQPQTGMPRGR